MGRFPVSLARLEMSGTVEGSALMGWIPESHARQLRSASAVAAVGIQAALFWRRLTIVGADGE